jgi:hypothetical protein
MKAITKGMHAMHAARRTCEVNRNASSFTEVVKPFSDRVLWLPVYNIEVSILSMGATDATLPGSASPFLEPDPPSGLASGDEIILH